MKRTKNEPSMISARMLEVIVNSSNKFCRNDGVVKSGCGAWKNYKAYNRKGYKVYSECY